MRTTGVVTTIVLLGARLALGAPVQITSNSFHDLHPELDGSTVVWQGEVNSANYEVFWSDLSQATPPVTQITTNTVHDTYPHVDGTTVVWQGEERRATPPPLTYEIFQYDTGTTATAQITNNGVDDLKPRVSGANIVWRDDAGTGTGGTIYLDSGGGPVMIGNPANLEREVRVDGSNVVWRGNDGDPEIFHYDIGTSTLTQITNEPAATAIFEDRNPAVNGTKVVWTAEYRAAPGTSEIYLYDLSAPSPVPTALTGYGPGVAGMDGAQVDDSSGYVVWYGAATPTTDQEIYLYDLNNPGAAINISNRPLLSDKNPQISGSLVVWQGIEVGTYGDEFEIFLYDIHSGITYQLTHNDTGYDDQEPKIDGMNIVWQGRDPQGSDLEIFYFDATELFQEPIPEPSSLAMLWLGAVGLLASAWRRRRR